MRRSLRAGPHGWDAVYTLNGELDRTRTSARRRRWRAPTWRPSGARVGQSGWITVRWPAIVPVESLTYCGLAQIAVDGGWIDLQRDTRLAVA